MITCEPVFYQEFHCLGGACPLTCCRDWEIVPDEDALADYRRAPQPLRQRIADGLTTDEEGGVCFRLEPDGRCALLDGDGLCAIQRQWGEAHLCAHCGAYPRFIEEYGCRTERSLAVSCPEAARLVMERGLFPLQTQNDGMNDPPFEGVDGALLNALLTSRDTVFGLLREERVPIWRRLARMLDHAWALQRTLEQGSEWARPQTWLKGEGQPLPALAQRLLALLARLEPLRPEWPALLRRRMDELAGMEPENYQRLAGEFRRACPNWEVHLERLACCFVFRHWPKAVNDDMLYGRAALTAAACLTAYHLSMLDWRERGGFTPRDEALLWAAFSREVEHMDENFGELAWTLEDRSDWPLAETFRRG